MAITGQLPVDGTIIDPESTVAFTVDNTYTYLRIEVTTASGVEYAYDSSLGGQQSGYTISVIDNGDGTDTFNITPDSGWDVSPQVVKVVEDETGTEASTDMTWSLSGLVSYPNDDDPYYNEQGGSFKVSEDNVSVVVNVSHLDFIAGAVDGITVTDLGGGKVRLTARATTNDPLAIHDNVANEFTALTEKTLVDETDLVIIEDSADSYAKKSIQKTNLGGARLPQKLESDYDAIMLYTFDGALTDSITGTHTVSTVVGSQFYTAAKVPEARALYLTEIDGVYSTPATMTSTKVNAGGDLTIQAVFFPGEALPESAGTDRWLFQLQDDTNSKMQWGIGWPQTGNEMVPGFEYVNSGGGTTTLQASLLVNADGMPCHFVARHWDTGGGSFTNEIWINNTMVAQGTGALGTRAYDGGTNYRVSVGKYGANTGLCRMAIDGLKVSNRKLTDAEIEIEFRKVMGYPTS